MPRRVAVVTLGCARNEVDSEELAGRLTAAGWTVVERADNADAVIVNTCGFVEAAKKDSVDALLEAADTPGPAAVVAVGCLAERYGAELAASLPEADAVLGFDDYDAIADRLQDVLAGRPHVPHAPRDRRHLLPLTPVERPGAAVRVALPGHATGWLPDLPVGVGPASGPRPVRRRLSGGPVAAVKLASGCDRRCAFCAIPRFRGSFVSRPPEDLLAEVRWLAGEEGVREIVLVSENSTSYGKDLGDPRLLERLLPRLARVEGVTRVRVSYLQPAELRPTLLAAIATTDNVAPYFDLSFQHASARVLRRMRRFGDTERFLDLVARVRALAPAAGVRSNVIVGFPGETEDDVAELEGFLVAARLDAVGVFGYSAEDGTEAATLPGAVDGDEINARVDRVSRLAEELTAQRAEDRVGESVEVLVETVGRRVEGRAAHQAPDVDGSVRLERSAAEVRPGDLVSAIVTASDGVDLLAVAGPAFASASTPASPVYAGARPGGSTAAR